MSYNYIKAAGDFFVVTDNKISHRFVKKIKIDGNFIYVGTADKLNIYNIKDDKVVKVEGLRDNYITAISYDQNNIWVGTPNGLSMVSKKDYSVKNFDLYDLNKKLPDNYVTDIVVDGSQIWIATRRWGVLLFDPTTSRWKGYSVLNGLAGNNVNALALDGQYIWAATDDGLSAYDKSIDFWKSYLPQDGLAFNKVSSIAVDGEFIWAGTMGGGLSRLNKLDDSFQNYNTSAGLVDDNIQCLTIDGKILWIGTFAGVNKFDKVAGKWDIFSAATGLPEDSVGDIAINGNFVWFATDGGGIARMDKVIPEAYLSPLTSYSKAGIIEILGTSYSFQDIASFVIDSKSEILNDYSTAGMSPASSVKVLNDKLAVFDVSRLINGTYYIRLTVKDKANNVNFANLPVIVDTVPPTITLDEIPDSVKDPEFVISGRYNEMNLIRITIANNGELLGGGEIDRVKRSFSAPITLRGGMNKVEVTAEDIAGQKTTIARTTIYDTDKPEFIAVSIPDKPVTASVGIVGQVRDYSLNRLVLNPGNIEVTFTPVPDKNYIYDFKPTITLVQGENRFSLDAYDMVGNKTTYNLKPIVYSGGGPVVVMNKSNNKVNEASYFLTGTFSEKNLKEIIITNNRAEGYIRATPDIVKQAFSAKLDLKEGENILTAYIVNNSNQKSFDVFNIYYSTEVSKFSLNDYNRYTSLKRALLTGRFSEPNLKDIVLMPGNIRASVDFKSNTFQVYAPVTKDKHEYQIVLSDKMGGTMKKDVILFFDDTPPKIKIDSIPPVVNATPLIIKGTIEDRNFDRVVVTPGNIAGQFNPTDKTFKVQVPLNAGENNLTLSVMDLAKNETSIKIPVKLIPQVTASEADLIQVSQAGDPELKAQIARLQQEIERLKAEKKVYVPMAVVRSGPRRVTSPSEKAVFFAPFDQKEGDTLLELSRYYLGSPSYVSLISALNDVLEPSVINRRKSLLMPSKSMVKLLNQYSIFDAEMQAVNAIAMSYNALGSSADLNDYFNKFVEFASMNRTVQPSTRSSALVGDVMVVLIKGRAGDLSTYKNMKASNKYKNIVIGQIGQSGVVYTIL